MGVALVRRKESNTDKYLREISTCLGEMKTEQKHIRKDFQEFKQGVDAQFKNHSNILRDINNSKQQIYGVVKFLGVVGAIAGTIVGIAKAFNG